jgi:hypothetical protein
MYLNRQDVRNMRKQAALTVILLTLIITTISAFAYAQTANVTIGYPSNSNGDLGITSGSYWIGQFPVQITLGTSTYTDEVYCMTYDGTVYEGSTYQAQIAPVNDDATWRAISYILSWYPATTNNGAAEAQDAIWRILGGYNPSEFNLPSSIENAGINMAENATGKDVVRQGDQLKWVSPVTGNVTALPGQTVTFQVQLTNSTGTPRPNVQIDFNATLELSTGTTELLNSTYVSSAQAFTDGNGIAQVAITVPSDTPLGSAIKVQASTQSVWPNEFIDLTSQTSSAQNLIGLGTTLSLTVSTDISVTGFIQVAPESAIGSITSFAAFAAAFVVFMKVKRPKLAKP